MSTGLPEMLYADRISKKRQTKFGGYNHNLHAQDGELWDMQNMSSDLYPLLSPRKPRFLIRKLIKPNGLYAKDGLYWVDGERFFADGTMIGAVTDSKKQFVTIGAYIIILPDMKYYNKQTKEFGQLSAKWSGTVKITDGTYVSEEAEANTIYAAGADWGSSFRVGDAVTISGCKIHTQNNTSVVIREIDGDYLRFYENTFVISKGGDSENITVERIVPDLDFACENENRVWGCKGNTIYASSLGDPFNWNVFDMVDSDSFQADVGMSVGSAGSFTGCCTYLGYPCFFKEENIYKVYGDKPSNYQIMGSASLGVEAGSGKSLAIAGETLFYLSRTGIVAYSGGIPQSISAPFGTERYKKAVAGSDGTKYYVSMQDTTGAFSLFVFDTRTNLWHKEDALEVVDFSWGTELYFLDSSGNLWLNGNARSVPVNANPEDAIQSMVEFGDFVEDNPNKKGTSKLQIRIELDAGASVTIYMQFDSDDAWREVKTLTATVKRSFYLPIIPRRSDHYKIKINGIGDWRLYSLVRESYSGSEL